MAVAAPRSRFGSLLLAALVATGACHDATTPTTNTAFPPLASTMADVSQDPTPDQKAVARVVPGFGGCGSPVFGATNRRGNPAGGKVILLGILWGGSIEGDPEFVYSPMFNIERELGLLTTH